MKPVIGIGAATWDHLYVVEDFPCTEGVMQAKASAFQGGGPVATALAVIAKAGIPCQLLDVQGGDAIGCNIREELQRYGIDLSLVKVEANANSAHAVVLVRTQDASRHITYFPSTAAALDASDVNETAITGASLLHLNGRHDEAARQAVAYAKQHGVTISFDGGAGRYRDSIRDLVQTSDVLIVAREFAQRYTGSADMQAMGALMLHTASLVVITDGTRGSYVWSRAGEVFHQPAFKAEPLIDTTGCGDIYHGAFLAAWLQQKPLRDCAEIASRLASINAQGLGGRYALGCSG